MTVRVDYGAPTTCPSRGEFLDGVRRYTTKWTLVDDGATRDFAIVLDRSEAAVRGTLEITVGGRRTRKVVSGPSCATVARALAVIVALVIDPSASISGLREEAAPPAPEPSPTPPAPQGSDEPASAAEGATDETGRQQEAERAPPKKKQPRRRGRPAAKANAAASAPRWMFELRQEVNAAVTTRPMTLIAGFVDLRIPVLATDGERSAVGPSSIGIGLRQSVPKAIGIPGGSTEFLLSAASMRICPLRLRLLGDQLDVAPCVEGNVGALQAESQGISVALRARRHWLDGGASVLGVWHLPGPWLATAGLAVVAPLTRHRFEVVDLASLGTATGPRSELVSQAPAVGISAGVGLGLEL